MQTEGPTTAAHHGRWRASGAARASVAWTEIGNGVRSCSKAASGL